MMTDTLITDIAAGYGYSMALKSDGKVYGWGTGEADQLGDNSKDYHLSPTLLPFSATLLATGRSHSIFVGGDGLLYGFGSNERYQLGNSAHTSEPSPVPITLPENFGTVQAIACSMNASMALSDTGVLAGWGSNAYAQLGTGTATDKEVGPVVAIMPLGVTFSDIALGSEHALGLTADGKVYAWGQNAAGSCGIDDGTYGLILTPTQITFPNGVVIEKIGASVYSSFAISTTGTLYFWGMMVQNYGLAEYYEINLMAIPTVFAMPNELTVVDAAMDGELISVIASDGKVYSRGTNTYGQFGDATTTSNYSTAIVAHTPAGATFAKIACSAIHTLALANDNTLYGWGFNSKGFVGDGSTTQRLEPVVVQFAEAPPADTITAEITSPSNGAIVRNVVTIQVSVAATAGIQSVDLTLNNEAPIGLYLGTGTETSCTFNFDWNTVNSYNGVHTITVSVADKNGLQGTATMQVLVFNRENATFKTPYLTLRNYRYRGPRESEKQLLSEEERVIDTGILFSNIGLVANDVSGIKDDFILVGDTRVRTIKESNPVTNEVTELLATIMTTEEMHRRIARIEQHLAFIERTVKGDA